MDVAALLVIVVVLVAVVAFVSAPVRGRGRDVEVTGEADDRMAELEARKEAKYREIRDAEMDLRTGKLSAEDHRVLDRQLRAEAMDVLREMDEAAGR